MSQATETRLTDVAGVLHFASHGIDPAVYGTNVSVEPVETLGDGPSHNLLLEVYASSRDEAVAFAELHHLTETPHLAARISPSTRMWSGWISKTSTPIRCVLYVPNTTPRNHR